MNNDIKDNIKITPQHKSKKKIIVLATGIGFVASSAFAISYANIGKSQPNITNHNTKEEPTKIENVAPKIFDKLPETITPTVIEQASSSLDTQTIPNLDIQSKEDSQKAQREALLNSELCDDCGNNQKSNTLSENDSNPVALKANYTNDSDNNFNELDIAKLQPSKASTIKNPEYIIAKGSFLTAILETKIDSSLKGMVSAALANDVYSMDGSILLLEKGSKITGQYTQALKEGAERLMVVWDRVRTPNGIIIDLNSFGTDSLGGSGLSGHVNHQYGKRFGSAILLSLLQDSLSIASKNNNITNNIQNTQQQSVNIAEQALSNAINIAPILYKNQGEYINIFVARDLDFSDVYKLKLRG